MNSAIICIGSNIPERREEMLRHAEVFLSTIGHTRATSGFYETAAETCTPGKYPTYLNSVIALDCDLDLKELIALVKHWEHEAGRSEDLNRQGLIAIDIDVVGWNGCIVRPEDFSRNYFQQGYGIIMAEEKSVRS